MIEQYYYVTIHILFNHLIHFQVHSVQSIKYMLIVHNLFLLIESHLINQLDNCMDFNFKSIN